MNGKKWRSIVFRTYRELLEEFHAPEIPLEFSKDGRVFATERAHNEFRTQSGKFREQDGIPLFLFPNYPELGRDHASEILHQRGMSASLSHEEPKPVHITAHEFYHYLEFLTHGPMTKEDFTEDYRRQSEAEAEDFANTYEVR